MQLLAVAVAMAVPAAVMEGLQHRRAPPNQLLLLQLLLLLLLPLETPKWLQPQRCDLDMRLMTCP